MRITRYGLSALLILLYYAFPAIPSYSQGPESFNVFIDLAGSYQVSNGDENAAAPLSGAFRAKDLRLDIKGRFGNALYYRFRRNMLKTAGQGTLDRFSNSTDMMFIGYRPGERFAVEAGKICQHWGGFDYDEVPLFIYQYSDYVDHLEIFFGGVDFIWTPVEGQEFIFEAANPSNDLVPGVRFPVNLTFNWNGSFSGGGILTRCAVGGLSQAGGGFGRIANGGIKFNHPSFQWYFDWMLEKGGVDRLGIASADLGAALSGLGETLYQSRILKAFWQFSPGWNLVAKTAWDEVRTDGGGKYRDSLLGLCSLEYYPVEGQNLRFFICGTGHRVMFHGAGTPASFNTGRAELGLVWKFKVY